MMWSTNTSSQWFLSIYIKVWIWLLRMCWFGEFSRQIYYSDVENNEK